MIKLLKNIRPSKLTAIVILILMFFQTAGTLYLPTLMADIVNNGIINGDMPYIYKSGGLMLIVAILTGLFAILGAYIASAYSASIDMDIRNALFTKAQALSIHDFNRVGTASMITRCTSDVTQVQQAFILFLQMVLPVPIITIGGLVLAYSKDKYMAVIIAIAVLAFSLVALLISKKAMPLFSTLQAGMDKINQVLRENIVGVRVIRAFNKTHYEKNRMDHAFTHYAGIGIRVNKLFAIMMPIVMLIMNFCTIALIWFGGVRVSKGALQIGDIMALVEYSMLILFYLIMGVFIFLSLPRAKACAIRINEVLDIDPQIVDGTDTFTTANTPDKLSFKDVTFNYDGAEEPVLNHLSFTCKKGETTAIIGGTGSGKSTIASLIPRFYDIMGGSISIDGTDIKSVSQLDLRSKIGYVPQKAFLFSGTIKENIKYGKPDASMEDIIEACTIAQAHNFISVMDNGYESFVSQGGNNYSGGQKQRLAIARALVKKPEIYVFDDSFSALDSKTDAALRKALKEQVKDSAVIIVAQRVSTIMDADQIIVLDNGSIAGIGTHEQLLSSCTIYNQIAKSQLRKEEAS